MSNYKLVSGTANPEFAQKVASILGRELAEVEVKRFSDGEINVNITESVRGQDVFIIQPTCAPANDNLMELLIIVDALKRSSAGTINAVIPYFGYARQDRKDQPRVAVTAKLVANLIAGAGADRVITMDLHAAQIQGFFDIPFDHLYASPIFSGLFQNYNSSLVVVSPDIGGIKMARSYAKRINSNLAVIDKRRPTPNKAEVMNIIGEVEDQDVLLVDDLIDTGGTFVSAIKALKEKGAKQIFGAITHPLLSGNAIEKIENSEITKLYVTDSIPVSHRISSPKIVVKTASGLLAEAIIRTHDDESISSLFDIDKS